MYPSPTSKINSFWQILFHLYSYPSPQLFLYFVSFSLLNLSEVFYIVIFKVACFEFCSSCVLFLFCFLFYWFLHLSASFFLSSFLPSLPLIHPYFLLFFLLEVHRIPTIYGPDRRAHTHREQWEEVEAAGWLQGVHGWLEVQGEWEMGRDQRCSCHYCTPRLPHKCQLSFSSLYLEYSVVLLVSLGRLV